VLKSGPASLVFLICVLVSGAVSRVMALEDLNREFTENFFRLGTEDEDARLKIAVSEVKPDEGAAAQAKSGEPKDSGGPSWVGKFLQLSIVFLLGLIVYLLSKKKRARGRFD